MKHVAPKASGVFYATPAEIPKTQQFGVSLTWCVLHVIDSGACGPFIAEIRGSPVRSSFARVNWESNCLVDQVPFSNQYIDVSLVLPFCNMA